MENIAKKYVDHIDVLLKELEKLSFMRPAQHWSDLDVLSLSTPRKDENALHYLFSSTLDVLNNLYGGKSQQVKTFVDHKKILASKYRGLVGDGEEREACSVIFGALHGARLAIENGLIASITAQAEGLVIGDLLETGKKYLKEGQKEVAAVLASAALEDAVKRKAQNIGLSSENKDLQALINALKAQGVIGGSQAPVITSYVKLRNNAMHADWAKIENAEVGSLIAFLEIFLVNHFS